jgi:hypothetical protein
MIKYNVIKSIFMLQVKFIPIKTNLLTFIKKIKINENENSPYQIYYRTDYNYIYVYPPNPIPKGQYCYSCGHVVKHSEECKDPINSLYYTIESLIDLAYNINDYVYIDNNIIYDKETEKPVINKKIDKFTKEDLLQKTKYHAAIQKELFKTKNRIVLKYKGTDVWLKNDSILINANPFSKPLFYKKVLSDLGVPEDNVEYMEIKSVFANIKFPNLILKSDSITTYIYENNSFGYSYEDYNISIINDRQKIDVSKMFNDVVQAKFALQFYKDSIQITLYSFISPSLISPIKKQIDLTNKLIDEVCTSLIKVIQENKFYENLTETEAEIDYYTIGNMLPYSKKSITNKNSLRKGSLGSKVEIYDNDKWSSEKYTIVDFIDFDNVLIEDSSGNRFPIGTNLIRLLTKIKGVNQVCRDITNKKRHHPVPYSFYGICPEYNQIINPIGVQSNDDNHFYPCCSDDSKSKINKFLVSFILNGFSSEDKKLGLLPKNDSDYDNFSGLFLNGFFSDYFEIKKPKDYDEDEDEDNSNEYIMVKLIKILPKVQDKFVVQDIRGNTYNIDYSMIHLKYRENRNFKGLSEITNDPKKQTEILYSCFKNCSLIKDLPLEFYIDNNNLKKEGQGPKIKYINYLNKDIINGKTKYCVPKYSTLFLINADGTMIDEYGLTYKIPIKQNKQNKQGSCYGFYKNGIMYTIGADISLKNTLEFKQIEQIDDSQIEQLKSIENDVQIIFVDQEQLYKWHNIYNFMDSSVFLKINSSNASILKKYKLNYDSGTFVKITFDLFNLFKVSFSEEISKSDYILHRDSNSEDKLNFILNYFNYFDSIIQI